MPGRPGLAEGRIARHLGWRHQARAGDELVRKCVAWTWKVKLLAEPRARPVARLREDAEAVAIKVFADNLRDLLLAAPAGERVVMGLDPGIRTGVQGGGGRRHRASCSTPSRSIRTSRGATGKARMLALAQLVATHGVDLIAIGNGTASRETDKLAGELIARCRIARHAIVQAGGQRSRRVGVLGVARWRARSSPTSTSPCAARCRIARRLQDPLAELVKIDPKSIGVGQYQHDVNQSALAQSARRGGRVCVNAVGVDLNTASAPLLARVSGLGPALAKNIVALRDENGPFRSRQQLLDVPRLRRQDLRAGGRLPAHPRRRQPARRLRACTPRRYRWSRRSPRAWRAACAS